jgi:hypothetical protein
LAAEADIKDMNRASVALFNERTAAETLQQRLVEAGISAEIHDHHWLQRLWFVARKSAGTFYLEVPADQSECAEQLLREWDKAEGALRGAIHCPECRSLRVQYPQVANHSLLTNLAVGLTAEAGLVERDHYCEKCHFTWPKEGTRPQRNRPHMAPYYFIDGIEQAVRDKPRAA